MSEGDFAIAWTTASRRTLTRLPEKVGTAVVEFLYGSLATNPHRVGKPLKLGLEGLHSARRGDYRVIYRIDDERRLVTVMAIEHRSDAYRPRSLPVDPPATTVAMLYMVIEKYRHGPEPVYQRAAERGRMLPDGLRYVDSWVVDDDRLDRCFQLMETDVRWG